MKSTGYTGPIGKGTALRSAAGVEIRVVGDLTRGGWSCQVVHSAGFLGARSLIRDDQLRRDYTPVGSRTSQPQKAVTTGCPDSQRSSE